jgi:hypothetical protein
MHLEEVNQKVGAKDAVRLKTIASQEDGKKKESRVWIKWSHFQL